MDPDLNCGILRDGLGPCLNYVSLIILNSGLIGTGRTPVLHQKLLGFTEVVKAPFYQHSNLSGLLPQSGIKSQVMADDNCAEYLPKSLHASCHLRTCFSIVSPASCFILHSDETKLNKSDNKLTVLVVSNSSHKGMEGLQEPV